MICFLKTIVYDHWHWCLLFFQWKQLSDAEKTHYEEKAKKINEENAIKYAEEKRLEEER